MHLAREIFSTMNTADKPMFSTVGTMNPADKSRSYSVDQFDVILVTTCDIHGVARGRFVFRDSVPGVMVKGLGMAQAALFCGIPCELPIGLTDYTESGWTNGATVPDAATLKPLSWLSCDRRKVGHLLCDLLDQSGVREVSSSREVALRQIASLKTLGYVLSTSHHLEFTIFYKGTLNPASLNGDKCKLLLTLTKCLAESGLPVASVACGTEDGKLLISLSGQQGIEAADNVHRLHCILRSLCAREGCDITFMTHPLREIHGNRSIYTYSLLAQDGRNVFEDASHEDCLSAVAHHWLAGQLHHNGAITALARPTWNCYTHSYKENSLQNSWTSDEQNRTCRLSTKISKGSGVSIVDRLPSSASNPYNILGAFIAAGIDGLTNKLQLKEVLASSQQHAVAPTTLSEALLSFENNKTFQELIGPKFAHRFIMLKREYEATRFEGKIEEHDSQDTLDLERQIYLHSL